jgi:hypothetical protein
VLTPKDQVAVSYGYQAFNFSTVDTAFHSNVIQAMYGHRISGRMDFTIGAGPQFTHIDANPLVCTFDGIPAPVPDSECTAANGFSFMVFPQTANHIGLTGHINLRYRFPKTTVSATYQRYNTSGSGAFAGARSDIVTADVRRPLNRVWDIFSDVGYSKNERLQLAGSVVDANRFSYTYAGIGLHRQFGRSLRAFVSYQYNHMSFDTGCPLGTAPCSNLSQRQVGSIGLDWTHRPIRLD